VRDEDGELATLEGLAVWSPQLQGLEAEYALQALKSRLLGEVVLVLLQPVYAMAIGLFAAAVTGFEGVPWWATVVATMPLLLRLMLADAAYVHELEEGTTLASLVRADVCNGDVPPPFVSSKVEAIDAASDGLAIVAVGLLQQDPVWRARFQLAWASTPVVGPGVIATGLPALMAISLFAASAVQLGVAVNFGYCAAVRCFVRSELAGLGAVAKRFKAAADVRDSAFVALGRVVFEAAVQIALQGSAVMASGKGLAAQPLLLASLLLSTFLGLMKVLGLLKAAWQGNTTVDGRCGFIFAAMSGGLFILWGVGRVLLSECCTSKMFNFGDLGCVEMPQGLLLKSGPSSSFTCVR